MNHEQLIAEINALREKVETNEGIISFLLQQNFAQPQPTDESGWAFLGESPEAPAP